MMENHPEEVIQSRSAYLRAGGIEEPTSSRPLAPQEARRLARYGSESDRITLAANAHGLPIDVVWALVHDPAEQVAISTLDSPDLPTEMLIALDQRFGERPVVREAIAAHPHAPLASKLERSLRSLPGPSIARFLDDVCASDEERDRFATAARRKPDLRLRELWLAVCEEERS